MMRKGRNAGFSILALLAVTMAFRVSAGLAPSAAVLHAGLPGENPQLVSALVSELKQAGYAVVEVNADTLRNPGDFSTDKFSLLVLPNAGNLPAASVGPIKSFMEGGGDIIALNAPLWRQLLIRPKGEWITTEEYGRQTAVELPEHVLFDFSKDNIANWQRSHFPPDSVASYETVDEGPAPGRRSLHVKIEDLKNWDTFGPTEIAQPFPEGHTLTVFSAKGGPNTRSISIEWRENDGSRWIAAVPLSMEWRRYVLAPQDFKYWESVPARKSDTFHPENARGMCIGMAFTHTGMTPGPQEYWIGAFGAAKMASEFEASVDKPVIPAMDTLAPGYKFFDATGVVKLAVREDQVIVTQVSLEAPGNVRSPQPRPGGGGFNKGRSWRWIPLVEAGAADGQWRGAPATLMVRTGDPFKRC